jgi:hypothetical protein
MVYKFIFKGINIINSVINRKAKKKEEELIYNYIYLKKYIFNSIFLLFFENI